MAPPPTLYDYYTSEGISEGLSWSPSLFSSTTTILAGPFAQIPGAGLNAVETYIPWNLHEPEIGNFDFGQGSSEFTQFLDVAKFLKIAQEEDLLAIVRPGPYICAEWDFGGLPSWLLRSSAKIRTSDPKFTQFVTIYFKRLLYHLAPLQFTKGGPIIAFQIENEYGNTKNEDEPVDIRYLEVLKEILQSNNIVELLFTSDTPSNGFSGTLPEILATANFQSEPIKELTLLKEHQPNKPLMVMEYWTGWFDHWAEKHHTRKAETFAQVLKEILTFDSSVNMYMFHGGTNWGFLNGANIKDSTTDNSAYQPDTTSYDYDAPLSEAGDYTPKYFKVKELISQHNKIVTMLPTLPELTKREKLPDIKITEMLSLEDLIKQSPEIGSSKIVPMELLDINQGSGQSYGYIVYRYENVNIAANSVLKIEGHVCDTVVVLVNGELKSNILTKQEDLDGFGYWRLKDSTLDLGPEEYNTATLDLLVENFGRSNYGKLFQFNQHKGLWQGNVLINDAVLENWKIIPLEFKKAWTGTLQNWRSVRNKTGPALYKAVLNIDDPVDTFIDMREWIKGFVVVNGFVLARYMRLGPQQTAYLPAPLLKKGQNQILVFEHFVPSRALKFVKDPIFETSLNLV